MDGVGGTHPARVDTWGERIAMVLDTEVQTYQKERAGLLCRKGHYVLIQGEKILGTWATYRDALAAGYAQCGTDTPFLVRQIVERDMVHHFA